MKNGYQLIKERDGAVPPSHPAMEYEHRFVVAPAGRWNHEVIDQEQDVAICECRDEVAAARIAEALNANIYPGDPVPWSA